MRAPFLFLFIALIFTMGATPFDGPGLADMLETVRYLMQFVLILVAGFMAVKKTLNDEDGLNLQKTYEAAKDAASRINDHLDDMPPELRERLAKNADGLRDRYLGAQLPNALAHIGRIRGKTLTGKFLRKARERILSEINLPTPLPEAPEVK